MRFPLRAAFCLTLSSLWLTAAPALATGPSLPDYGQTADLAEQIRGLEDQQFTARSELALRMANREQLRRQAAQARRGAPALAAQARRVAARADSSRRRLNAATEQYIRLVRQLGQDPTGPALDAERQLVEYLSTSRMKDAALVFQLSSQLLDQQAGMLAQLRRAALAVQRQNEQLRETQKQQRAQAFLANGAEQENETRIAELQRQIDQRQGQIDQRQRSLYQGLALDQSRGGNAVLTKGQVRFSYQLAAVSGLDVNVVKAWVFAEMNNGYARGREKEHNHNWLNVGYFDRLQGDGAFQDGPEGRLWKNPISAGNTTAAFLEGIIFGASQGIQDILLYAGGSPSSQLDAICSSGWASSGYDNCAVRKVYQLVPHSQQPPRMQVRWKNPRDGKTYLLGRPY